MQAVRTTHSTTLQKGHFTTQARRSCAAAKSRSLQQTGHRFISHRNKNMVVTAAAANDDVQGEMLEPSLANNPLVRVASIVAITAVSAKAGGALLSAKLLAFVHLMAFGTWFGTLAWTSTVFGIVAFRNLPRQTFGKLQSKLFPKYFTVTVGIELDRRASAHRAPRLDAHSRYALRSFARGRCRC